MCQKAAVENCGHRSVFLRRALLIPEEEIHFLPPWRVRAQRTGVSRTTETPDDSRGDVEGVIYWPEDCCAAKTLGGQQEGICGSGLSSVVLDLHLDKIAC